MKKTLVLGICATVLAAFVTPALAAPAVPVIPAPAVCVPGEGSFTLSARTRILWDGTGAKEIAKVLQAGLRDRTGLDLAVGKSPATPIAPPAICLQLAPAAPGAIGEAPQPEAYTIVVAPSGITVQARSAAGLFYGAQSLCQLAGAQTPLPGGGLTLPSMRIEDRPRYAWRGYMLDESRHFFGKQAVKELLDVMASLKLNRFHWHLTDEPGWRIEIKKYPELTRAGARGNWSDPNARAAFYTQADVREIVACAAQRHIMVIPEIDMPGHATAACRAYPGISGGGKGQWDGFTFNPAKEETYRFLEDVLREVIALFPAPYVHLGGDEVHYGNQSWSTDPEIVAFTRKQGLKDAAELEQYFVRRMAGVIQRLGKTTMGWDEIAGAGVPPAGSAVMWWRHDKPQVLTDLLQRDYRVVLCPRLPCYLDFVQHESHNHGRRWQSAFNDLARTYDFPDAITGPLIPGGKEENVLGLQACAWTERIQNRERLAFMTYPRLAALAEAAWTPASARDKEGFMRRLPLFLRELDRRRIPHFDPFNPSTTPEPPGPEKQTSGTANG